MERQDEIDFLMEEEYALQSRLDRIHERLETLLVGQLATKHLVLIRGGDGS